MPKVAWSSRLACALSCSVDTSESRQTSPVAWRFGLGAALAGALLVALKYALRPPTRRRVPDTISPARFTTKVLHTSLGEVVFHEAGRGRPVVFVHSVGLGASSFEWAAVYPAFAESYRVLALDLVGFGESSRPDAQHTAAGYARMLAEFLRALEWDEPPILVASGLGAGFCVQLAGQHPELVGRLILHLPSGAGDIGRQRLTWFSRAVYRTPLLARFLYRNHLATRSAVAHWLRRAVFADAARVTEEMIDIFTTCAQQPGAECAALHWMAGRLGLDLEARLAAVRQPVALLWSGAAPIEAAARLQNLAPSATLTLLPEAGAMPGLERPAETIAVLAELLRHDLRVVLKAG